MGIMGASASDISTLNINGEYGLYVWPENSLKEGGLMKWHIPVTVGVAQGDVPPSKRQSGNRKLEHFKLQQTVTVIYSYTENPDVEL